MPTIKGDNVEFSFRVTGRHIAVLFAAFIAVFSALECGSEEYSISAFYPVPYGGFQRLSIYKELQVKTKNSNGTDGSSVLLSWPKQDGIVFSTTGAIINSYNHGYAFYADGGAFRIEVRNGSSSAININPVNVNTYDNKIMLLASSGHSAYMDRFCYWHATTISTCLSQGAAADPLQWSVLAIAPTISGGLCDGYTMSNNNIASTYCVLCCKMGR
ncbi:MAG: hypothetical protein GX410_09300 [Elusimicrobia bacterium]|nr:hypothetical protein [Elusimicrobiota bacterium]